MKKILLAATLSASLIGAAHYISTAGIDHYQKKKILDIQETPISGPTTQDIIRGLSQTTIKLAHSPDKLPDFPLSAQALAIITMIESNPIGLDPVPEGIRNYALIQIAQYAASFIHEQGEENLSEFVKLPQLIKNLIIRTYKLTHNNQDIAQIYIDASRGMIDQSLYLKSIYLFSIQELIENKLMPQIRFKKMLDCRNLCVGSLKGLLSTPKIQYIDHLQQGKNQIQQIPPEAFRGFIGLTNLSLFCNQIETIHLDAFKDLHNLEILYLNKNKIKKLLPGIFRGLHKLEHLDLSDNEIEEILPEPFENLANLRTLLLGNNQIKMIPPGAFKDLPQLETLLLNDNKMTTIDPKAFKGLQNLKFLSLGYGQIQTLLPKNFEMLCSLKSLFLHSNKIKIILPETFHGLGKLEKISLEDNPGFKTPPEREAIRSQLPDSAKVLFEPPRPKHPWPR